jgi:predicted NBD/HSP70 family sugar kinase
MANASHLRRINERKIVQMMLRLRTASRAKLAELAGMSPATVGRIIDHLIARDVITETPGADRVDSEGSPTLGRPVQLLELDHHCQRFLLIQLGVRHTHLAVSSVTIPRVEQWQARFTTPTSADLWLNRLCRSCAKFPLRNIEAVVLSCPSVVDEGSGNILFSPNIRWTEGASFPTALQSVIQKPTFYVQEIRALALGQLAVEPHFEDFLLVDSGDSTSAAAVIRGQLQSGHIPLSGELGHTPVRNNDRPCTCGAIGCVETLISRKDLLKSFHDHGGQGGWNALLSHVKHLGLPQWLKETLDVTATTVVGALNLKGISNVLCSGSLMEFPKIVFEYLSLQIRSGAMWSRLGIVNCRTVPRRRMAGLISSGIDRALFMSEL